MSARGAKNILVGIAFNAYDPLTANKVERASEESVEQTAKEVLTAVTELGYSTFVIPLQKSFMHFSQRVKTLNADVLINLCEAFLGRPQLEANVAAALELLGVPFTGNDSRTLALCLNKFKTKAVLKSSGLPTASAVLVESPDQKIDLPFPLIVKPNTEDASLGIGPDSVVRDEEGLRRQLAHINEVFGEPALVEAFIEGREFNVAVFDAEKPEALPVSEIDFAGMPEGQPNICGYAAKWLPDDVLFQIHAAGLPGQNRRRPSGEAPGNGGQGFLRLFLPGLRPGGLPGGQKRAAVHPRSQSQSRHQPERRVCPGTGRGRDRIQDVLEAADR